MVFLVEFEERIGRLMATALKALRGELDERLAAVGVPFHAYLVLRHVAAYPDVSQRCLAYRLGIEGSTLTHHFDRLAADGLIERVRSRTDRRVWSAVLTPLGKERLAAADAVAATADDQLRSLFSPAELETLTAGLQRITDVYGRQRRDHDHPGPD